MPVLSGVMTIIFESVERDEQNKIIFFDDPNIQTNLRQDFAQIRSAY